MRGVLILLRHNRVSSFCRRLIDKSVNRTYDLSVANRKDFGCKKVVWQYWAQGFDSLPELVRICMDSVDEYCKGEEYAVVRLTDANLSEYISLPVDVLKNINRYSRTFFSDFVRCCVLAEYGGCWLDSTVLLTGKINERFWREDFFVFRRNPDNGHKKYWKNAFAYYYGWLSGFKVRTLSSIIFAKKDNRLIIMLRDILVYFFENGYKLPDYFFLQILVEELLRDSSLKVVWEDDTTPHLLQQYINDPKFDLCSLSEIMEITSIHKLTYKSGGAVVKLKKILDDLT